MKFFKHISYKKKNRALAIGSILFAFAAYNISLVPTIDLYKECNTLESSLNEMQDIDKNMLIIKRQLGNMDAQSGTKTSVNTNIREALLGTLTSYCQSSNVLLKDFPKTNVSQEGDYKIETNVFVVEGAFTKLLKLIYLLEQKNRIGKIASTKFEIKKDLRTQSLALTAAVYMQNIKKIEHEN